MNETTVAVPVCYTRRAVLVDSRVIATFPYVSWNSQKQYADALRRECRDFEAFLRDHRSQDLVTLHVEAITEDQCSACGCEWESYTDDEGVWCANCGARVTPAPEPQGD